MRVTPIPRKGTPDQGSTEGSKKEDGPVTNSIEKTKYEKQIQDGKVGGRPNDFSSQEKKSELITTALGEPRRSTQRG